MPRASATSQFDLYRNLIFFDHPEYVIIKRNEQQTKLDNNKHDRSVFSSIWTSFVT